MEDILNHIRQTPDGQSVPLSDDLYLFRVPKFKFRHGQSYALLFGEEMILIDAVHAVTKAAVAKLCERYRPVGLILTHSDLIGQSYRGVDEIAEALGTQAYAHPRDHRGLPLEDLTNADDFLEKYGLSVHHVPGHTPGSVLIYAEAARRLFTGDCAVGSPYDSDDTDFSHPPIGGASWSGFRASWRSFEGEVREIYPLHGKPLLDTDDFDIIKTDLMLEDNVME